MTTLRDYWINGRHMLPVYNRLKNYDENILRPKHETIVKMARELDLTQAYIKSCLSIYAYN